MLFNSFEYLLFLPVVFLIYWLVCHTRTSRNVFIVAASYVFYGWWDWRFLLLIAFTTLCSYLSGIVLGREGPGKTFRRFILWGNVAVNLGILFLFKYFDFFAAGFTALLRSLAVMADSVTLGLVLPVGISFYTFQALSYVIDVYKRKIGPTRDVAAFFAFISFFPQLVAGPIERATNLLPQFLTIRTFDYAGAVDGMRRILWGLFKKMVVADNCAVLVDSVFRDYHSVGSINLWIGVICFSFQIYGDFSGYSDIAIGTARLFGIRLMQNFSVPYFSRDIGEFWRRWHISLTTWFRDYVYFPMGGSRCSKLRTVVNTMTVFLISGFWHGASWGYVMWGAGHGLLFVPRIMRKNKSKVRDTVASGRLLPNFSESLAMGWTFLLVAVLRILYRCATVGDAWEYVKGMFSGFTYTPLSGKWPLVWIAVLIVIDWIKREAPHGLSVEGDRLLSHRWVRWTVYYAMFMVILFFSGTQEQFIYFQF